MLELVLPHEISEVINEIVVLKTETPLLNPGEIGVEGRLSQSLGHLVKLNVPLTTPEHVQTLLYGGITRCAIFCHNGIQHRISTNSSRFPVMGVRAPGMDITQPLDHRQAE